MDIFSLEKNLPTAKVPQKLGAAQHAVLTKDENGIIHHPAPRGNLSQGEIRQKLKEKKEADAKERAESLEISRQAKLKAAQRKKEKELEKGIASGDEVKEEKKNADIVLSNNPSDPQMKEKLKAALSSGAVNFSGKEQQVLAKILNKK